MQNTFSDSQFLKYKTKNSFSGSFDDHLEEYDIQACELLLTQTKDLSKKQIFTAVPLSTRLMYGGTEAVNELVEVQRDVILDSAV